ncbi:hypothetical protein GCM10010174_44110 [Kutzneria viridogrisea]|uniref:Uncharacterized protein n=1 Tax=Kutzneria viridogrisea TaxID=47990 RepID=A0ABR6BNY5_9PSEU|nr:hypothetical protein [Kutzneria viridogrisea]
MAEIVDSVRVCGADRQLAALTSMHDLVVAARPVPEAPPIAVLVVRSPSSGHVGSGHVLIEHRSTTGHDDHLVRPSVEAVPLFWRLVAQKFGIEPVPVA